MIWVSATQCHRASCIGFEGSQTLASSSLAEAVRITSKGVSTLWALVERAARLFLPVDSRRRIHLRFQNFARHTHRFEGQIAPILIAEMMWKTKNRRVLGRDTRTLAVGLAQAWTRGENPANPAALRSCPWVPAPVSTLA